MPHIYKDARKLEGTEKIGDKECVTLVKNFTRLGWTGSWHEGAKVVGTKNIAEGTAIATFVNGKWPGLKHGNHSGFYLGQTSDGIYMIDQWPNMATKRRVSKRFCTDWERIKMAITSIRPRTQTPFPSSNKT